MRIFTNGVSSPWTLKGLWFSFSGHVSRVGHVLKLPNELPCKRGRLGSRLVRLS